VPAVIPTRTGDNEVWYRVRGKRRRPRVIVQPGRDGDDLTRASRPSEAAGSERPEVKTRSTRAPRPREGHGEGQVDQTEIERLGAALDQA